MNCENLQFELSLYIDNVLDSHERAVADEHLAHCPLCRQKIDDFAAMRGTLRTMSPPALPKNLVSNVRLAMRAELAPAKPRRMSYFSTAFLDFLQMRAMPFAVGTAATLLIGSLMIWAMFSISSNSYSPELASTSPTLRLPSVAAENAISITDFVAQRGLVSSESPSINPSGALVELTRSFANSKIKEDEVVVVADVTGDGVAKIEEIVAPLDDQQTVFAIEKAMRSDSGDAPFVPAFLDRRAESMRVVIKIQRVDIQTSADPKKK